MSKLVATYSWIAGHHAMKFKPCELCLHIEIERWARPPSVSSVDATHRYRAIQWDTQRSPGSISMVYNECDLVHVHSLGILAGKILHWSYGKVDILCYNFHINPRVIWWSKCWTSFEMCLLTSYQKLIRIRQCNLLKYKILRFLPLGCVQIVPAESPASVVLL